MHLTKIGYGSDNIFAVNYLLFVDAEVTTTKRCRVQKYDGFSFENGDNRLIQSYLILMKEYGLFLRMQLNSQEKIRSCVMTDRSSERSSLFI